MKKWIKILIAVISTPIILIIIFVCTYVVMNSQDVIEPYHVCIPDAKYKVLIASQGSEIKNKLVKDMAQQLKND